MVNSIIGINPVNAQELLLPKAGVRVSLSPSFNPPVLKGLKIYPNNPLKFDFILDQGDRVIATSAEGGSASGGKQSFLKEESTRLIKYFLATVTTPQQDIWVNLSPYEKDRIIPESFGKTAMGRDLLAQDYMLKQITASLMYPEDEVGKKFWKRIYAEAAKKFGTTNVPVNTFNKVWIVPDKAVVYENIKSGTVYVVESSLKVMLETDYVSLRAQRSNLLQSRKTDTLTTPPHDDVNAWQNQIIRDIIIPELTKEVNTGKNFAQLRQIHQSLILAMWYKKKIQQSILSQFYVDQNKVAGIAIDNVQDKQQIYQRYLQAFKKGTYNYIKDEIDPLSQQSVSRKYFSGGFKGDDLAITTMAVLSDEAMSAEDDRVIRVELADGSLNTEVLTVEQKLKLELEEFGFQFIGRSVLWNDKYVKSWKPNTVWAPKEGDLKIKKIEELHSFEIEAMVPYVKASHQLFLSIAIVDGLRQPIVIKQYSTSTGGFGYYAMAFVPGKAIAFIELNVLETRRKLTVDQIAKRKKITAYFITQGLHPPEEFIFTPDGNVVPIDAERLYFINEQGSLRIPEEEPAKEYVFSQLGGPRFLGVVRVKNTAGEKDPAIIATVSDRKLERANTGGIDLSSDQALQVKQSEQGSIDFKISPAMLQRLQSSAGFTPVILSIEPLNNLRTFLDLS